MYKQYLMNESSSKLTATTIGFIPFSKDHEEWRRREDHNDNERRRNKLSEGISPRSFYRHNNHIARILQEAIKGTKDAEKRKKLSRFLKQCSNFISKSVYREFPLQELAFTALDELNRFGSQQTRRLDVKMKPSDEYNESSIEEESFRKRKRDEHNKTMQLMWDMTPRIFAIETSKTGKRKYIVCHLGRFMHRYWRDCTPNSRHFYELIREDVPCRLYFDLEYNKEANHQLSHDTDANIQFMQQFIRQLTLEIKSQFNIDIHPKNIVDLDSSTESKFSRHLIVHMPKGELFRNAIECGMFVKNFVGRLVDEIVTDTMDEEYGFLKKYFLVHPSTRKVVESQQDQEQEPQKEKEQEHDHSNILHHRLELQRVPFVDTGVYTRNRLFRLLGSAKHGKPVSAALRIAESNQFPFPDDFGNHKFYKPDMEKYQKEDPCRGEDFCDTRVGESNFDKVSDDSEQGIFNWESYAVALEHTFVTPSHINDNTVILHMRHQHPDPSGDSIISKQMGSSSHYFGTKNQDSIMTIHNHSKRLKLSNKFSNHLGPSPFPPLEEFIEKYLAGRKGICGSIRAWTIDSSFVSNRDEFMENGGKIIYQMKNNRWCENIQRCHKSNNIMWNISLVNMTYWQTCHDPDCRMLGFRGEVKALPSNIVSDVKKILMEEAMQCNKGDNDGTAISGLDKVNKDLNHVAQDEDDEFASCIEHELLVHPELFP